MTPDPLKNPALIKPLEELSQLIAQKMGLHFSKEKRQDLWRIIKQEARSLGEDPVFFLHALLRSPYDELEKLAHSLTISETYFFREPKSLEAFENKILPSFINSQDRPLKIWSAGCSTGEEPYTLAMILHQKLPLSRRQELRIYGTDINQKVLVRARQGVYSNWSFRETPEQMKKRYFQSLGEGRYAIKEFLKEGLSFSYFNLAQDPYPSVFNHAHDLDVIFCRNVMIYFGPEMRQHMINGFYGSLVKGGWLIVAPAETSILLSSQFTPVSIHGATLYQKTTKVRTKKEVFTFPESLPPSLFPERKQALKQDKKTPGQIFHDAHELFLQRRYSKAQELLTTLFSQDNRGEMEVKALSLMARINANQGHLSQALSFCEKALHLEKGDPQLFFLKGVIYKELGQRNQAYQAFKRTLYLDPQYIAAHYLLADLSLEGAREEEAQRHLYNTRELLLSQPQEGTIQDLDGMTIGGLLEVVEQMMEGMDTL